MAESWWPWLNSFSASGLAHNNFGSPNWYSNTVGWRHGSGGRYSANVLFGDGHIGLASCDKANRYANKTVRGVRTDDKFFWRPREHTEIGDGSGFNSRDIDEKAWPAGTKTVYPFAKNFRWDDRISPSWYTMKNKWSQSVWMRKGWKR